jgi:hypothetical protein
MIKPDKDPAPAGPVRKLDRTALWGRPSGIAVAVLVALAAVTAAFATPCRHRSSGIYVVTGTIVSIEGREPVLILRPDRPNVPATFSIGKVETRVKRGGKDIDLGMLKPGQRVTVDYRERREGRTAVTVWMASAEEATTAR